MSDEASSEVDGPAHVFRDKLLDEMVGKWKVTAKMAGRVVEQFCQVEWVLNHQFLLVRFMDAETKRSRDMKEKPRPAEYEAMVFIGYDNMSERYVVHWLDVFGGRFSETLGFGRSKAKNSIIFVFEGPGGPLHNTFTWNSSNKTWSIFIEQKDTKGKWTMFADETLRRIA